MNQIIKNPVNTLGYNFIPHSYLPKGKDEYYLRNSQNKKSTQYRGLSAYEIEVLVRNRNTSANWNHILVSDAFNPELVQDCKFYGLVRIGKLEPFYLEFNNLRRPVGLYNSTIISCDFGDNVVIDNVNYISHYIIGDEVILVNVNEMATTDYAKFGNGILKEGEDESIRIWLELCNENGGRKVIPFEGMLPGDAFLWTQFRDDQTVQSKFKEFTENRYDKRRGYYGMVGDRTVIKNCKILKDVNIGSDAYLKGANKLKNLTINSSAEAHTQIGEGCELVNGIIDYGCRIFYGVKAVRFFLASHSQLKYGARLINAYLGNNSTISCCEVLNSLIFPAHEQHHNNSFLCAALLQGQTNMAAGATIGSNHNSRGADGELISGRGFWPGLCVSLKHNSKFASFTIIAKGDFPAELNIPLPFSLVSNDVTRNCLVVMPGYWFIYNMYALARNSWKYVDRDQRIEKTQFIEYSFLAPDSINEMVQALDSFCEMTGAAYLNSPGKEKNGSPTSVVETGRKLLEAKDPLLDELEILAKGYEHSNRKVRVIKIPKTYHLFKELIIHHAIQLVLDLINEQGIKSFDELLEQLPSKPELNSWKNIGGQLIPSSELDKMMERIRGGKIKSWNEIHQFYISQGEKYPREKLAHALAAFAVVHGAHFKKISPETFGDLMQQSIKTKEWMLQGIYSSRAKDYNNSFRRMIYSSAEEMNTVVGKLENNSFIRQEKEAFDKYKERINFIKKKFKIPVAKQKAEMAKG
jgi:hypothetical protein